MNCECFSARKEYICNTAARNGHLECLKCAHENGCPWDEYTCALAAANGNLNCLKYAHENGCPWHQWTCRFAAEYGHLDCLKYAYENGCPWNWRTVKYAINRKKWSCAIYAIENGCPHRPTDIPTHLGKTLLHRKARRLFPQLAEALRQRGRNNGRHIPAVAKNKY